MPDVTYNDHTEETAILSADKIPFWKAASAAARRISWANLLASDWPIQTLGNPASGFFKIYFKGDGLYIRKAGGVETGPFLSANGWRELADTWTYASAITVTVPTDATTIYKKGWGVRFKQGGSYKYFYITGVAATTLTLNGGSDYTVANSAITDVAVTPNPAGAFGFPVWFDISAPAFNVTTFDNGAGGQPTTNLSRFRIEGLEATYQWQGSGFKAGAGTTLNIFADTYIPLINRAKTSGRHVVGVGNYSTSGTDFLGWLVHFTDNNYYYLAQASVADNTQLTDVGFQIHYEV